MSGEGLVNYQFTVGAGNGGRYELWANGDTSWFANIEVDGNLGIPRPVRVGRLAGQGGLLPRS